MFAEHQIQGLWTRIERMGRFETLILGGRGLYE